MNLRKVGFFFELPVAEQARVLQSLRRKTPAARQPDILRYLRGGTEFAACPGLERDVLEGANGRIIGSIQLRTDGVFAWPESLEYYVERYHIGIPDDFVAAMAANGWQCPGGFPIEGLGLEGDVTIG